MRLTTFVVLICATIGFISLASGPIVATPTLREQGHSKWEYKVLTLKRVGVARGGMGEAQGMETTEDAWEKQLNDLGEDGWEVVGVSNTSGGGGGGRGAGRHA